jgi:hypothetical protein
MTGSMQRITIAFCLALVSTACEKKDETTVDPDSGAMHVETDPDAPSAYEPKDDPPETDRDIAAKTCDDGKPEACVTAADMFEKGEHGAADPAKAREYQEKGCVGGIKTACSAFAVMLEKGIGGQPDPKGAREIYLNACETGNMTECYNAAVSFEKAGGPDDLAQAGELFAQVCKAGQTPACVGEARLILDNKPNAKAGKAARATLQKACDGGDPSACYDLAIAFEDALGGKKDAKKAAALKEQACVAGHKPACGAEKADEKTDKKAADDKAKTDKPADDKAKAGEKVTTPAPK